MCLVAYLPGHWGLGCVQYLMLQDVRMEGRACHPL